MIKPIRKVCTECGGENLHFDANAEWCVESQEMVLVSSFDHVVCNDCEKETGCQEVEIENTKN